MSSTLSPPAGGWWVGTHAAGRLGEMDLSEATVLGVLDEPDLVYPGPAQHDRPGQDRRVAVAGSLAVVVDVLGGQVITVLWHRRTARSEGPVEPAPRRTSRPPVRPVEDPAQWRELAASRGASGAWRSDGPRCSDCGASGHRSVADAFACDEVFAELERITRR